MIVTLPAAGRCALCSRILVAGSIGCRSDAGEHAHSACAIGDARRRAGERVQLTPAPLPPVERRRASA